MQIYTAEVLCTSFYDPNQFELVVSLERAAENFPAPPFICWNQTNTVDVGWVAEPICCKFKLATFEL